MKPYYIIVLVVILAAHWSLAQESGNEPTYLDSIKMGLN